MSSRRVHPGTFKFVIIAIVLMVVVDRFWFDRYREQKPAEVSIPTAQEKVLNTAPMLDIKQHSNLDIHYPSGQLGAGNGVSDATHDDSQDGFIGPPAPDLGSFIEQGERTPIVKPADVAPKWHVRSVPVEVPEGWRTVAIVIDDLGENRKYSFEAIKLPSPMTMALLPYSQDIDKMAAQAIEYGHETLIHMPMEPMNPDLDLGSISLKVDQASDVFEEMLGRAFSSMNGFVGINNHMGSKLTQNEGAMNQLMLRLKKEGLLFLDSKTISNSIAASKALEYDVPYAVRDVFLDHDPSEEGVRKSIKNLERVIDKYGHATAIGHPKEHTVNVLREWVKTLDDKKIKLVPVSYSVKRRMKSDLSTQAALPQ